MNQDIMQHVTDNINMQDDKMDGGMGLGNSMGLSETGSSIDLDSYKPTVDPEFAEYDPEREAEYWQKQEEEKQTQGEDEQEEEKQTQGEYERELQKTREKTENIRNDLDLIEKVKELHQQKQKIDYYDLTKLTQLAKDYNLDPKDYQDIEYGTLEKLKELMENELTTLYDREYEIMNNDAYDPRDYGETRIDKKEKEAQDREDDETNRAVEAMRKAGLNPATLSGNISYGGGGGISSGSGKSSDEEDEKERRKRKKAEEAAKRAEEAARQRQQQQMIMQIVQLLGGIGGNLGAAAVRNAGLMGMSRVRGELSGMNMENIEDYKRSYGHRSYRGK